MKRKLLVFAVSSLLVIVLAVTFFGCTGGIASAEISADFTRKATESGSVTDEFVSSTVDFSLKMFKETITKDKANDLASPLSALICLAMLCNGADGETKAQMEKAFGLDIGTLNTCIYAFTSSLQSEEGTVRIADSIWMSDSDSLHVKDEFLQTNADWYGAQVYTTPFDKSTVKDINNWCSEHTDGMIDKIIDSLDKNTVMCLINALTFDADWNSPYGNSVKKEFNNYDGTKNTINALMSTEYNYLYNENTDGFVKQYAGNKYSFAALLPKEGMDIYDYAASLSGEKWLELWKAKERTSVKTMMPAFSYKNEIPLNDPLKRMGMTDMFEENADFSRLGTSDGGNIYCGEVKQKTFIEVTKAGTRAAAVTIAEPKATSAPVAGQTPTVYLDRPFVYAIVDNATGIPLFIGLITNL